MKRRYTKLGKLGEGTYGIVWKAVKNDSGEIVAIKKIRLENPDEGIPATAIREISYLKELKHPNIVALVDVETTATKLKLVFEFLEYDLKKYMTKYGKISPEDVKSFAYQTLCGIAHCHAHRHLHRDLKPQNLLINEKKELKLADFGLARAFGNTTRAYSNEVVTLWYRPPDVLLGSQQYNTSIDVWSSGCIHAEMVTGKPLFPGRSNVDELLCIFKILGTPDEKSWPGVTELPEWANTDFPKYKPTSLREICLTLEPQGHDLLLKMLEMNPIARISAAEALAHPYFDNVRLPEGMPKYVNPEPKGSQKTKRR